MHLRLGLDGVLRETNRLCCGRPPVWSLWAGGLEFCWWGCTWLFEWQTEPHPDKSAPRWGWADCGGIHGQCIYRDGWMHQDRCWISERVHKLLKLTSGLECPAAPGPEATGHWGRHYSRISERDPQPSSGRPQKVQQSIPWRGMSLGTASLLASSHFSLWGFSLLQFVLHFNNHCRQYLLHINTNLPK